MILSAASHTHRSLLLRRRLPLASHAPLHHRPCGPSSPPPPHHAPFRHRGRSSDNVCRSTSASSALAKADPATATTAAAAAGQASSRYVVACATSSASSLQRKSKSFADLCTQSQVGPAFFFPPLLSLRTKRLAAPSPSLSTPSPPNPPPASSFPPPSPLLPSLTLPMPTHSLLPSTLSLSLTLLFLLLVPLTVAHFFFATFTPSSSLPSSSPSLPSSPPLQQAAAAAAAAAAGREGGMAEEAAERIVVYVTVPNKEEGQKLSRSIVDAKLAACVNRVPGVESTYMWQGKVETDSEELLIIKTRRSLLPSLTDHVNKNHPYDLPEVIALPIVGGSEKYLHWISDNTMNV